MTEPTPAFAAIRSSIAASVLQSIRQALPTLDRSRSLESEDRLADLGVGSLSLLTLILDLEERFQLSATALARLTSRSTVGALLQICVEAASTFDNAADPTLAPPAESRERY